jgi:lipopolysaccharide export system protein LptA
MIRWYHITLAALILAGLAVGTVALAETRRTDKADINADKLVYNFANNTWEFTGNVTVDVKGPDKATMSAPRMSGKLGKSGSQLNEVVAYGPVQFAITLQPDADGVQRRITATCTGQALYTGAASTIVLVGGAEGQMVTLPQQPDASPATFKGDKITINLADSTIEMEKGTVSAEFESAPAPGK